MRRLSSMVWVAATVASSALAGGCNTSTDPDEESASPTASTAPTDDVRAMSWASDALAHDDTTVSTASLSCG